MIAYLPEELFPFPLTDATRAELRRCLYRHTGSPSTAVDDTLALLEQAKAAQPARRDWVYRQHVRSRVSVIFVPRDEWAQRGIVVQGGDV